MPYHLTIQTWVSPNGVQYVKVIFPDATTRVQMRVVLPRYSVGKCKHWVDVEAVPDEAILARTEKRSLL